MKTKHLLVIFLATLIEGIITLTVLFSMTFDPGRGQRFNYVVLRLALAGAIVLVLAALMLLLVILFRNPERVQGMSARMDKYLVGPQKRLFLVQGALIITAIFLFECFLMTYLAIPVPMRPVLFWAGLTCLQTWLVLRVVYVETFRQRPGLAAILRTKWNGWLPVQRKTFIILAILGLVYFTAFIPVNGLRDEYGNFYVHADEKVLYPDITNGMIFPNSISGMVHAVLESWPWQYGYPYFTASATVLLIPRLVFGINFTEQVQLNIFLLRQFVSVAPMVLSMLLVVYLSTRFKSILKATCLFIFLATVPGIVKYNVRFWHADSLIVLLILLTILMLEKDRLRFGSYYYLAAVFCSLAAALKLWGLFFGPVIAGYLLAGWITKKLSFGRMALSGGLFVLTMLAAIIISSPTLIAPYIAHAALRGWLPRQGNLLAGYAMDTTGEYDTGLTNWLKYFGFHYMKGYFFYFSIFTLLVGSLWGSRIIINRILLGWCTVTALFLAYFLALKNFQYMLPLAAPLFCGAFLFPAVTEVNPDSKWRTFLAKPVTRKFVWGITILMVASQFIINLIILYLYWLRGH